MQANPEIDLHKVDITGITSMNNLFINSKRTNWDGLEDWDMSRVLSVQSMFQNCPHFNVNLDKWNLESCENIQDMFKNCTSFNQPIAWWEFKDRIRNASGLFENCTSFNQPLDNFLHKLLLHRNLTSKQIRWITSVLLSNFLIGCGSYNYSFVSSEYPIVWLQFGTWCEKRFSKNYKNNFSVIPYQPKSMDLFYDDFFNAIWKYVRVKRNPIRWSRSYIVSFRSLSFMKYKILTTNLMIEKIQSGEFNRILNNVIWRYFTHMALETDRKKMYFGLRAQSFFCSNEDRKITKFED